MTHIPSPVTEQVMGRKPLGVRETKVRLPIGLPERIDALEGPNRRAEFIREAVEREVERREKEQKKSGAKL